MSVVTHLKKNYDNFVIDIPQWEIPDQGISVLWGPSGSGKTSIIKILVGIEESPEMLWHWNGQDIARLSAFDKNISIVFQDYRIFPHMSVFENLNFAWSCRYNDNLKNDPNYQKIIQKLNIEKILHKLGAELSGGEQQRVALSRALIVKPRLMILDEPFSALDEALRQEARELLRSLCYEINFPVILITHDREDVLVLGDRVFKVQNGKIILQSSSKEFNQGSK